MSGHVDVLVVGAGISGIAAGYHLATRRPDHSFAIVESRARLGGTWDLFRYPGVRSDSDMYTLGFSFAPWTQARSIADGGAIRDYLADTAARFGIDRHIRFGQRVVAADWSSDTATWSVTIEGGAAGDRTILRCGFLYLCTGYYDYARGHAPDFADADRFAGRIIHPQFWPPEVDHSGKRVVVIGSGATAVTLVPEMAKTAAHVTMLQRSPSYVVARPSADGLAKAAGRVLPGRAASWLARWKNVLLGQFFFTQMRRYPERAKARLLGWVRDHLGPDYDVARHFTPSYDPWDQRLCLVPDADLFAAIRAGTASVVTDRIAGFTAGGIALASGEELPADIVVTATGLELQLMSGIALSLDGVTIDPARSVNYKGAMFSDLPNLALSFGYTNASWTLKTELTARYVCRVLGEMRRRGMRQVTPRLTDPGIERVDILDFTSGYIRRSIDAFPKQGTKAPWRLHQNYIKDLVTLRFGAIDDGSLEFSNPPPPGRIAA